MSLQVPSSPSENSSVASDSPHGPLTPLTPPLMPALLSDTNTNPSPLNSAPAGKRKPSRRANTAERRATHNAVERQRRETLNGRFLDLAGLLPNLSQIRRPSKSAIVNSSIAHIHASRRHRLVAARELRLLKLEADALRRELNEWRDRSGLPRVEEPVRGDGFGMVLSGEVEVVVPSNPDDEEGVGDEEGEDDLHATVTSGGVGSGDDMDDLAQAAAVALLNSNGCHQHPQTPTQHHQIHGGIHGGPMIAGHTSGVSYENPAIASFYDGLPAQHQAAQYGYGSGGSVPFSSSQLPPHVLAQLAVEMESKTNSGWYNNISQFSPPTNRGSPGYGHVGGPNVGSLQRWMGDDGVGDSLRVGPGAGNGPGYAIMM